MRKMPVLTLLSLAAVMAFTASPVLAITNGPEIDNNNRIVGEPGGNIFYNGIAPGETLLSVEPLGDISLSPNGDVTATAMVTIGEVSLDADRNRSSSVVEGGENTAVLDGQLTATLNEDGSYAITAADEFDSEYIVTFATAGDDVDAVHLLAAPATNVDLSEGTGFLNATGLGEAEVDLSADEAVFTLPPETGRLVYASAVEVGDYATVSLDYNASSAEGLTVAAVGFDGGLDGLAVRYNQVLGTNVEADVTKNVACSFNSLTGTVVPAFQVTNSSDSEMTVTVSDVKVINARPLPDYALDPNVTADGVPGTDSTDGWSENINNDDAGSVSSDGGALVLSGTEGGDTLANAYTDGQIDGGEAVAECYVQSADDAGEGAFFALVLTDGANASANAFVPAGNLSSDSMSKVTISSTFSEAGTAFVVAQAFNFTANVQDVAIRLVTDEEGDFDENLVQ